MMRVMNQKVMAFFLVVLILVSGLYFENVQVEASFEETHLEQESPSVRIKEETIKDGALCTAEMLGVRNNTGIQQLAKQYGSQKRESKIAFDFLFYLVITFMIGKFFTSTEIVGAFRQHQKELILNYIHDIDGKKHV